MSNATNTSRIITLGLLAALTGVIWTIALAQQPSLFS